MYIYIYNYTYSLYSHMDLLGSRPPSAHKRVVPGAGFTGDHRYRGCNLERFSGTCSSCAVRIFWIADVHPPLKQIPSPNPSSTCGIDHSGFGLGWISFKQMPMVGWLVIRHRRVPLGQGKIKQGNMQVAPTSGRQ